MVLRKITPLICAAILLVGAGCGSTQASDNDNSTDSTEAETNDEVITIGAILPLTGPFAAYGEPTKKAMELVMSEHDNQVAGKRVELVVKDSGGSLDQVRLAQKELIESNDVSVIIGPLDASLLTAVLPDAIANDVITFGLLQANAGIGEPGWLYFPNGSLDQVSAPLAQHMYQTMDIDSVSIQSDDFVGGWSVAAGFAKKFTDLGGTIDDSTWTSLDTTDYSPYLTDANKTASFAFWHAASPVAFVDQYRSLEIETPLFLLAADILSPEQLSELGTSATGLIGAITYTSELQSDENAHFVKAFSDTHGYLPSVKEQAAWDDLQVIFEALTETNGDATAEALQEALNGLTYNGPGGPVTIDPDTGIATRTIHIVEVGEAQDGSLNWIPVAGYENQQPDKAPLDKDAINQLG